MTLKNVVERLRSQGHSVSYVARKDGSIRVTKIDGMKFESKSSKGNAMARSMAGQSLSQRQVAQRTRQLKNIARKRHTKKTALSPQMRKLIQKTQRRIRKASGSTATVTTKTVRARIEQYGTKATKRHLERLARHFEGWAYEENVEALVSRLTKLAEDTKSAKLAAVAKKIHRMRKSFKDAWIKAINEITYDILKPASVAQFGSLSVLGDALADRIEIIISGN